MIAQGNQVPVPSFRRVRSVDAFCSGKSDGNGANEQGYDAVGMGKRTDHLLYTIFKGNQGPEVGQWPIELYRELQVCGSPFANWISHEVHYALLVRGPPSSSRFFFAALDVLPLSVF